MRKCKKGLKKTRRRVGESLVRCFHYLLILYLITFTALVRRTKLTKQKKVRIQPFQARLLLKLSYAIMKLYVLEGSFKVKKNRFDLQLTETEHFTKRRRFRKVPGQLINKTLVIK